jgi:hypothetical protein
MKNMKIRLPVVFAAAIVAIHGSAQAHHRTGHQDDPPPPPPPATSSTPVLVSESTGEVLGMLSDVAGSEVVFVYKGAVEDTPFFEQRVVIGSWTPDRTYPGVFSNDAGSSIGFSGPNCTGQPYIRPDFSPLISSAGKVDTFGDVHIFAPVDQDPVAISTDFQSTFTGSSSFPDGCDPSASTGLGILATPILIPPPPYYLTAQ